MTDKSLSTIEQTLVEVIQKSVNAVEKGALWAQEQIPQIAEQFLTYHLISSAIYASLCFILVSVYAYLVYKIYRRYIKDDKYLKEHHGFFIIFGGVGSLISVILFIKNTIEMIKILMAPKIYLMEWAASVLK